MWFFVSIMIEKDRSLYIRLVYWRFVWFVFYWSGGVGFGFSGGKSGVSGSGMVIFSIGCSCGIIFGFGGGSGFWCGFRCSFWSGFGCRGSFSYGSLVCRLSCSRCGGSIWVIFGVIISWFRIGVFFSRFGSSIKIISIGCGYDLGVVVLLDFEFKSVVKVVIEKFDLFIIVIVVIGILRLKDSVIWNKLVLIVKMSNWILMWWMNCR